MYTWIAPGYQEVVVSSDMESLDLAQYVRGGQLQVRVTIESGVTLGGSQSAKHAIYTSVPVTEPSASQLIVLNNGTIQGANGDGGNGGGFPVGVGGAGGDCIAANCPMLIDNTGGLMYAGGGGGGGGGEATSGSTSVIGGGGGGGYPGGAAGPARLLVIYPTGGDTAQYGAASGGNGGQNNTGRSGGNGGNCQGIALDGTAGGTGNPGGNPGGAGGAAGRAVNASGNTVTWLGGFNGTQVKGAVV